MKKINIKSLDNMAVKRFLLSKSVIIMLLIFTVVMGITTPGFLSFSNMSNMLQDISIYGVAACGMTILIIAGEFDLSASSQYMLSMLFFIASLPAAMYLSAYCLYSASSSRLYWNFSRLTMLL